MRGRCRDRQRWLAEIQSVLRCSSARAFELLDVAGDAKLSAAELAALADHFNLSEEDLLHAPLVAESGVDILTANMNALLEADGKGSRKALGEFLDVAAETVSRWGTKPTAGISQRHQRRVAEYFGLPVETDLSVDRIFLRVDPISSEEARRVLMEHLSTFSMPKLKPLLPALQKLLS